MSAMNTDKQTAHDIVANGLDRGIISNLFFTFITTEINHRVIALVNSPMPKKQRRAIA
jgi:hypothetical protein